MPIILCNILVWNIYEKWVTLSLSSKTFRTVFQCVMLRTTHVGRAQNGRLNLHDNTERFEEKNTSYIRDLQ